MWQAVSKKIQIQRQTQRQHKDKHKDKYKNNQQTYDVICFWKGDDNRSLIMKNVLNMKNMQKGRSPQICTVYQGVTF